MQKIPRDSPWRMFKKRRVFDLENKCQKVESTFCKNKIFSFKTRLYSYFQNFALKFINKVSWIINFHKRYRNVHKFWMLIASFSLKRTSLVNNYKFIFCFLSILISKSVYFNLFGSIYNLFDIKLSLKGKIFRIFVLKYLA